ncbi:hypothetical protein WJX75_002913 [Coccomyxa subellipsoidea]|uniref:WD40 repeat-like protein n=1 Tax=Coccomyxa subellipsoidea TaxID=248742 RepID=A0ABR2YGB5_9CHLO
MDPDIPLVGEDEGEEGPGPESRSDSETDADADFEGFVVDDDGLTTSKEHVEQGSDPQNIPWDRLQVSRQRYRETRLEQYHNYVNLREVVEQNQERLQKEKTDVVKDGSYYGFHQNLQSVRSDIAHFQLRHLLWTTSKHDVYTTNENCINHFSTVARKSTKVLDLSGASTDSRLSGLGRVQISTFCVRHDLMAAGGFAGELIVANLKKTGLQCSKRVTTSEMGITNGIDIFQGHSGGISIMTANNDNVIRIFDSEQFRSQSEHKFEWPVNLAIANPSEGSSLAIVVGDDPDAILLDLRTQSPVMHLKGHLDYSFAASWHPNDAHIVATGNQDTSTRIWDLRQPSVSKAIMCGNMGAVRSLRYSADGKFLAASEPADFVRLYDVDLNYTRCQEIDLFGEIGGCSFTPDSSSFFLCVADVVYSSLMEFTTSAVKRTSP